MGRVGPGSSLDYPAHRVLGQKSSAQNPTREPSEFPGFGPGQPKKPIKDK